MTGIVQQEYMFFNTFPIPYTDRTALGLLLN